jgi:small subunit ribosomal protein S5
MKTVASMDGNIGKVRRYSCVCFTGNRNGLGGLAMGKSPEGRAAIKKAKNRAGQKLLFFQRYRDHTGKF